MGSEMCIRDSFCPKPYTADDVATGYDEFKMYAFKALVVDSGDCKDTVMLASSLLRPLVFLINSQVFITSIIIFAVFIVRQLEKDGKLAIFLININPFQLNSIKCHQSNPKYLLFAFQKRSNQYANHIFR